MARNSPLPCWAMRPAKSSNGRRCRVRTVRPRASLRFSSHSSAFRHVHRAPGVSRGPRSDTVSAYPEHLFPGTCRAVLRGNGQRFAMAGVALFILILALIARPGRRAVILSAVLFLLAGPGPEPAAPAWPITLCCSAACTPWTGWPSWASPPSCICPPAGRTHDGGECHDGERGTPGAGRAWLAGADRAMLAGQARASSNALWAGSVLIGVAGAGPDRRWPGVTSRRTTPSSRCCPRSRRWRTRRWER